MARYKPIQRNGIFVPVVFEEQIQPGTFEFALHHLVDDELDLSPLDAKFRNDATGAAAYDPRVLLKIVLLAYSRGLITSRQIEQACQPGDARPSYTHIAKFVRELGPAIHSLFTQVLMTCCTRRKTNTAQRPSTRSASSASTSSSARHASRVSSSPPSPGG
jgi:transposase